ncbi:MAG: transglutaminase family protein [Planctomycetota bacterium]
MPTQKAVRAAAELLLDANPKIHGVCEERLAAWGEAARPALIALAECDDSDARARVHRILRRINVQSWLERFRSAADGGELGLEQGAILLCKLLRPLFEAESVGRTLDEWASRLAPRLSAAGTRSTAVLLGRFFNDELGFRGDRRNYYERDNCLLDQVISRRQGIPISLCTVYLLVGRRIGLPLEGLGLPGHFILRLRGARSVLLDPFHGGHVLTRSQCMERVKVMGYRLEEKYFVAMSDRKMLARILGSLIHASMNTVEALSRQGAGSRRLEGQQEITHALHEARRAL